MGIISRIFSREKNALVVLTESNAELRQLLFLEKKHSAELLQQLSKALGNAKGNVSETPVKEPAKEPAWVTPREEEVLHLLKVNGKVTSASVSSALNYSCRQVGGARLAKMLRKGLIKKVGSGKLTAYRLA